MNVLGRVAACCAAGLLLASTAGAQVHNLKVVTDASPDYYDMPSMIHSITARWPTPEEKCRALFYWNHVARRQTSPMTLHGQAVTDPIRQFNDYGYTMCSTIAGINCSIWDAMGLPVKYWDISNHTVSEVFYNERWHLFDNSMSAVYTLCDGKTLAGVEDIGKTGACAASGGRVEPGHIARYHCLNATSNNGFLTGADCPRSLEQEYRCFNPNALKYRYYFNDWDRGHRYILNLRPGEVYTRYYESLGNERKHYVPNGGKDPEVTGWGKHRFKIRGNGVWTFKPSLAPADLPGVVHEASNVRAAGTQGLQPAKPGETGEVVFKIDGANVITGMTIRAAMVRNAGADLNRIAISTTNGLTWKEVWRNGQTGPTPVTLELVDEVNGSYEVLVKVELMGKRSAADARLESIEFETLTMHNSKTQPRLLLGKNTVHVGRGDPTGSIVLWPDLQGESYRPFVVEQKNIVSRPDHPGYMGVMHAERPKEEACVVFRIDAPRDITRLRYGGRLYNRAPKSHIDFLHSFDGGTTWTQSYSLADTKPPWDVIHYETVDRVPPGTKSVLVKYLLDGSEAGSSACSIYAVRMEANYEPADPTPRPVEVTFRWSEVQADRSLVERSHTAPVRNTPHRYTINVGGADHPVVDSLRVNLAGAVEGVKYGYSDARETPAEKFVPRRVTYGKNLAEGKPYTVSIPSGEHWGSGDPEGKKLTDGVVGSPYAGGIAAGYGLCWTQGKKPAITVDLGRPERCGAFRIHVTGYPFWDAMKGEVEDQVEVLTSSDGEAYTSHGPVDLSLRWKDLPANQMWPDDEQFTAPVFELIPPEPVRARYVRFQLTSKRFMMTSEVQVLDFIKYEPFDLRIALPGE